MDGRSPVLDVTGHQNGKRLNKRPALGAADASGLHFEGRLRPATETGHWTAAPGHSRCSVMQYAQ